MPSSATRRPVDPAAASLMVLLCFLWGFSHVLAKLAAADVSLVMQGGLRSILSVIALFAWCAARRIPLWSRDATLIPGTIAGLLFAAEFLFIFTGLAYTGASRMVVFIYLAPCVTALGLHFLVPAERLDGRQWLGIALAFVGIALAFLDGFRAGRASWLGDASGVVAAVLWGATTIVIRTSTLASAQPAKTLFYQLLVTAIALPPASIAMGEPGIVAITPVAVASLLYQALIVSFASYLAWFWLLTRYLAARLSVFTFLTPMFGVIAGVVVLGEPLRGMFLAGVLLVGAGIYLVNRRAEKG